MTVSPLAITKVLMISWGSGDENAIFYRVPKGLASR